MTDARKAKFRRWARDGVPKRAQLAEKRAFGAFLTNRRKKTAKLGTWEVGKTKRYETKKTRGRFVDVGIDEPLSVVEYPAFRARLATFASDFLGRKRNQRGFARLRIIAAENPYSPYPFNVDGDMAEHWFGAKSFTGQKSARESIDEICDKLALQVLPFDNGEGRVTGLHVFTVRNKRK